MKRHWKQYDASKLFNLKVYIILRIGGSNQKYFENRFTRGLRRRWIPPLRLEPQSNWILDQVGVFSSQRLVSQLGGRLEQVRALSLSWLVPQLGWTLEQVEDFSSLRLLPQLGCFLHIFEVGSLIKLQPTTSSSFHILIAGASRRLIPTHLCNELKHKKKNNLWFSPIWIST